VIEHMCEYLGMNLAEWADASGGSAFGAGRRVVVADLGETSDNLVRDMTDVLMSFGARLYGYRGARNRVLLALACAKRAPEAARVGGEDD